MSLRLIINADDYGRTLDISRGIREAHLRGMVTSSTTMLNMPSAADDLKIALKETPNLGLGVHLVLTAGKPLLPAVKIPSLTTPAGNFHKLEQFVSLAPSLNLAEAKAEWQAQIETFIATVGKKPTHLDSHHHSSYFTPGLLQSMFELAREYGLPIRLPIAHGTAKNIDGLPEELIPSMLEFAPQLLEQFQPRSPEAFFASFYDENATRGEFLRILSHFLPNGTFEIMCHPGYVDEAFARESAYAFQRQTELEILTDPAMLKEVERRGIQLISFAQL
jgi:chitin disaccharide deacetylase